MLHPVFRVVKREEQEKIDASKPFDAGPKLDLSFKEGQTIKININVSRYMHWRCQHISVKILLKHLER